MSQHSRQSAWAIAIAASAGGIQALLKLLGALPAELPAVVFVVQHIEKTRPSALAGILQRSTTLVVAQARGGVRPVAGHVYVAPPNRHLSLVAGPRITLTQGPLVHYVRPSANVLFNAVALSYGRCAIAVILTGTGKDGAEGAGNIRKEGGIVVVQDEATSQYFGMPGAAIEQGHATHIVPLDGIAPLLVQLTAS